MLKNKIYVVGSINIDEKISIDSIPKAGETKHGKIIILVLEEREQIKRLLQLHWEH